MTYDLSFDKTKRIYNYIKNIKISYKLLARSHLLINFARYLAAPLNNLQLVNWQKSKFVFPAENVFTKMIFFHNKLNNEFVSN